MSETQKQEVEKVQQNLDGVIEEGPEALSIKTANALIDAGAVTFHFEEGIEHRSGIKAPIYVNVRKLFGPPETRALASELLAEFVRQSTIKPFEVIVGVASGGQAPAQELANQLFMPRAYVRKDAKGHGEKKSIEGYDVKDKSALVIEDTVNLGTSSLPAVETLRAEGATVTDVLCVVSYGFTKTKEQFAEGGVTLHTLTTVATIVEVAHQRRLITRKEADQVLEWLREQDKNNENI